MHLLEITENSHMLQNNKILTDLIYQISFKY